MHLHRKYLDRYPPKKFIPGIQVRHVTMCRNQFFHFTTGIGAGIVLSVLILTFLLQRKLKVGVDTLL